MARLADGARAPAGEPRCVTPCDDLFRQMRSELGVYRSRNVPRAAVGAAGEPEDAPTLWRALERLLRGSPGLLPQPAARGPCVVTEFTQLACRNCKRVQSRHAVESAAGVLVPIAGGEEAVQRALAAYGAETPYKFPETACQSCGAMGTLREKVRMGAAPTILAMELDAFGGDPVAVALERDVPLLTENGFVPYGLQCVVVYRPGHYIAYVKSAGVWWECDDSTVAAREPPAYGAARLIFYEKYNV